MRVRLRKGDRVKILDMSFPDYAGMVGYVIGEARDVPDAWYVKSNSRFGQPIWAIKRWKRKYLRKMPAESISN